MNRKVCPACVTEIDDDRPGGLCPACLLKEGLTETTVLRDPSRECSKCGNPLGDDVRFCSQCGAPVAQVATEGDPIRTALSEKLRGEYHVIRLLGQGGMGAVYLAKDLILEREVAVKVLKTRSHDGQTYDRFRREARTAAKLSHPNIVPLHTFGEVDGMPYFVMGYVRGEPLSTRLQREGKTTEDEGLRLLAEIADALDHAHRQGVVHRDIKPENILIEDETGRAMLTDFGVAKALGQEQTVTRTGSVIGTPHYMSPEQARGQIDIDGRSDIYSLGVTGYALLAGRLPFTASSAADMLTKHLTQEPPSLRSLNTNLSHATAQAIERCLAKDPASRWPDARSLKLALGVSGDDHLPDALQSVDGRGFAAVAIFIAFLLVTDLVNSLSNPQWTPADRLGPIITMIIGATLIYLFVLTRMGKQGFTTGQFHAAFWREPSWWLWWYPRMWRRRGNVWDRLPPSVRIARGILPATFVIPFVFIPAWLFWLSDWFDTDRPMEIVVITHTAVLVTVWFLVSRRAHRRLQREGIYGEDIGRVLHSVPPSHISFWRRPHIAPVLEPDPGGEEPRETNPHQHLQSILRYADELSGPLRPLGSEASSAARRLVASIEDADREIAGLAKSFEAGEEERLTERITALSGADTVPLRKLLERELELIRGLSERMAEAREIRSRRMEMLRSLSRHLAALRARSNEKADSDPITDRVRSLCDEIAAHAVTPLAGGRA